jgi:hypothetical protein
VTKKQKKVKPKNHTRENSLVKAGNPNANLKHAQSFKFERPANVLLDSTGAHNLQKEEGNSYFNLNLFPAFKSKPEVKPNEAVDANRRSAEFGTNTDGQNLL